MHIRKSLSLALTILVFLCLIPWSSLGEDTPASGDNAAASENITPEDTGQNVTPAATDPAVTTPVPVTGDPPAGNVSSEGNATPQAQNTTARPGPEEIRKAFTGWYQKGMNASAAGNYQAASDAFAAALRLDKGSEEAQLGYASVLAKLGRHTESLEIYTRVQNQSPTNTSLLIPLGREQNAAGKYQEAFATLQNATFRYPENPEAWNQLAAAYAGLNRYEEALTTVRKSLQLSVDQAGGWGELGAILYGQGRFYEAVAAYEKAITLDPRDAGMWEGLADTWAALNKLEKSTLALSQATAIRPKDTALWIELGDRYEKLGNTTGAADAYTRGGRNLTEEETPAAVNETIAANITTDLNQTAENILNTTATA